MLYYNLIHYYPINNSSGGSKEKSRKPSRLERDLTTKPFVLTKKEREREAEWAKEVDERLYKLYHKVRVVPPQHIFYQMI